MMSLQDSELIKLLSFSDLKSGCDVRSKYVLACNLDELKTKGKEMLLNRKFIVNVFVLKGAAAFGLHVECEIVTSCGTPVEEDDVLFFLIKKATPLYLMASTTTTLLESLSVSNQQARKEPKFEPPANTLIVSA